MASCYTTGGAAPPPSASPRPGALSWLPLAAALRDGTPVTVRRLGAADTPAAAELLRHAITVDRAWPWEEPLDDAAFVAYWWRATAAAPVHPTRSGASRDDDGNGNGDGDGDGNGNGNGDGDGSGGGGRGSGDGDRDWGTYTDSNDNGVPTTGDPLPHLLGAFYVKPNFPGRCDHLANGGFVTAPAARRRGVGSLMAAAHARAAADLGYRGVVFNLVFANNAAAVALWERVGMRRVGTIPAAARMPAGKREGEELTYVDAYILYRSLV
ncbi:hypothetical protein MMPV_000515 [Pyropia vietnamensis]